MKLTHIEYDASKGRLQTNFETEECGHIMVVTHDDDASVQTTSIQSTSAEITEAGDLGFKLHQELQSLGYIKPQS